MNKPERVLMTALRTGTVLLLLLGCRGGAGEPERRGQGSESPAPPESAERGEPVPGMEEGQALYESHCLVCHQANGGGVPGLNPPLKNTEYVMGSKSRLLRILINGSNEGLKVKGQTYSNAMPGFSMLSDQELALLATFIRNSFGNRAPAITATEVATVRSGGDVPGE